MDKRFFSFLLITVLFYSVYSFLLTKYSKPVPADQTAEQKIVSESEKILPVALPLPDPEQIEKYETDNFIVTYSLTGGYIKSLYSKKYQEEFDFHNLGFIEKHKDIVFSLAPDQSKAVLSSPDRSIIKEFVFNGYQIIFKIKDTALPGQMVLATNSLSENRLYQRYQEFFYKTADAQSKLTRTHLKKAKSGDYKVSQAGVRDRYFCYVMFGDNYDFSVQNFENKELKLLVRLEANKPVSVYAGPQLRKELAPLGLGEVIYYGVFTSIAEFLKKILYFLLWITKSWGLSIMLLSLLVYGFLFPFTAKSTRSMKQMQLLQPKMEELKEKYKDKPEKLNKEMIEIYKKHKINPLGGCLPVFFQFPVFIALYQMLLRFVEMKGASFLWIKDLSLPDRAFHLPFTVPVLGEYLNVLPLILMLIGLLQHKYMSPASGQGQQKQMGMFMGVFIGLIFYNFPSCLVLYWFVQNLLTFIYQFRMSQVKMELA